MALGITAASDKPYAEDSKVDLDSGPPAPVKRPKKASPTSLYSKAGQSLMSQDASGLGSEGGSQEILAYKAMGMISQAVQILSGTFPGITPILSDLMGRLTTVVPMLVNDLQNGGSGMFPVGGIPPQMPSPMPALPTGGAPGMGGMVAPPTPIPPPPGMAI